MPTFGTTVEESKVKDREYVELKRSRNVERYPGVLVICEKKTGNPIDIGPGSLWMRRKDKNNRYQPEKYFFEVRVECVNRKEEWRIFVKAPGIGATNLQKLPIEKFSTHEFSIV